MLAAADPAFPYWFPFVFVGGWLLVTRLASWTGWSRFAARYPAPARPPGESFNVNSARFGFWSSYNNAVNCIPTKWGLYLYPFILFRPWHAPFLVPWSSVVSLDRRKPFLFEYLCVDIQDEAGRIRLRMPVKAEDAMRSARDGIPTF